jgi:hypothetical protein
MRVRRTVIALLAAGGLGLAVLPAAGAPEPPGSAQFLPAVHRAPGQFFLGSDLTAPNASGAGFGDSGDIPLLCDWDGDGDRTWGIRRGDQFFLDHNGDRKADVLSRFGLAGDVPICGDWNGGTGENTGDGIETVGVIRGNTWHLTNGSGGGALATHVSFTYGDPGDVPFVGDWDGDGGASPGVRRGNTWYLRDSNSSGIATVTPFGYGDPGDTPVIGDWDHDGDWTIGVRRGITWYLRDTNSTGAPAHVFGFGDPTDRALVWFRPVASG